jgi:hypothetical protein
MPHSSQADRQHFLRGIRTSTANNASAYGFSLTVAGSFGALTKVHGDPSWLELYLFLAGSCLGFALVNALSTFLFRKESPDEPELVISFATSLSVFSVCAAVSSAIGIAYALSGWLAWLAASIMFTLTYVVCVGGEIAFAAYRHPEGGAKADRRD